MLALLLLDRYAADRLLQPAKRVDEVLPQAEPGCDPSLLVNGSLKGWNPPQHRVAKDVGSLYHMPGISRYRTRPAYSLYPSSSS